MPFDISCSGTRHSTSTQHLKKFCRKHFLFNPNPYRQQIKFVCNPVEINRTITSNRMLIFIFLYFSKHTYSLTSVFKFIFAVSKHNEESVAVSRLVHFLKQTSARKINKINRLSFKNVFKEQRWSRAMLIFPQRPAPPGTECCYDAAMGIVIQVAQSESSFSK